MFDSSHLQQLLFGTNQCFNDLTYKAKFVVHTFPIPTRISTTTAQKTVFAKSQDFTESSERPSKYHLSINFLAEKMIVFPITEKFKTRTSQ